MDKFKAKVKSRQFVYQTDLKWKKERKGLLACQGKPTIEVTTPPEFKGHAGFWTPEELLVASVNACIMTTFLYYAEKKKFNFLSYESCAEGILERVENKFMFSTVEVSPRILVSLEDDIEKAKDLLKTSEENCFISNSLKAKIILKPKVKVKKDKI